ncbi:MAG: LysM peptidoglycan-binding domain-containing M23 family metallopeptidase [Candidatus Omnitrophica bacterium]|nr:LysM peptidoglycan-binding domain-containing M23 family metallopeptidase [Candidatus Omnitrophota bacterium]
MLLVAMAGCTPYHGNLAPGSSAALPPAPALQSAGTPALHRVARGETLWSISRRYGVKLSDLTRENGIGNSTRIEVGQRLRIPERSSSPVERGIRVAGASTPAPQAELSGRASSAFVWPVQGRVISIFGARGRGRVNKGVDIQAPAGADVRAVRRGQVDFTHENLPGFGKTIIIDHGDGFASVYAYVGEILVHKGDAVSQRQVIARVGSSGRSRVPALHFQIRRHQKPQNPLHYLP